MSEFTPSFPAIKGFRHIPDSQAEAVFASPETEVIRTYPFKADSFHIDDTYSPNENRIFVDGHMEDKSGLFHHTIFDIKRPGALRRCFVEALNREPSATVRITQYRDMNPNFLSYDKRRYSMIAAISSARKANSRKTC